MTFDPRNILVIDFGQLGDVVMSLPAVDAIRERFPRARITIAVGKPGAEVIEMSGCADATISVDRVGLRDGFKPLSVLRVFQVVKDVRSRKFDFVIDLHSFSETNLLGFLSGAPQALVFPAAGTVARLSRQLSTAAADRRRQSNPATFGRSLSRRVNSRWGSRIRRVYHGSTTRAEDNRAIDAMLRKSKAETGAPLVGLFPGAGHPGRCWPAGAVCSTR